MIPFRHTALALPLLAGMAALAPAMAADPAPATLTVTGEGSASVAPDMASVSGGVVSEGKTAAEALAANNRDMAAVLDALKKAGIKAEDLQTSGLSVQPRYVYPEQGSSQPPRIEGYEVRNQVTARVRDLAKLGGLLDTVVSTGTNQVDGVTFDVADPAATLDKARAAAVADAKHRAEALAQAAGVKLGRIAGIGEGTADPGPRPVMAYAAKADAVPIEPGQNAFKVRVTVTWEIAP